MLDKCSDVYTPSGPLGVCACECARAYRRTRACVCTCMCVFVCVCLGGSVCPSSQTTLTRAPLLCRSRQQGGASLWCLELSRSYLRLNDLARARKFAEKSRALFATEEALRTPHQSVTCGPCSHLFLARPPQGG